MARTIACLLVVCALALPAAAESGSVTGQVKNSAGVPQMGARVELMAGGETYSALTDGKGFYTAGGLPAGVYSLKVSAPSFLPSLREKIALRAGASLVVNVTLNTLSEALQLLPARRRAGDDDEDWKWTLRSVANRPILRVLDDGPLVVVANSDRPEDRVLKARVAFVAGADAEGFGGSSDMSTTFAVESSLFRNGTLSLDGDLGYGQGLPSGAVRAAYSQQTGFGSMPEIAFTYRRFAPADVLVRDPALQALALSLSDGFTMGDVLELRYGAEMQSIEFMGRLSAFRPFATADLHLGPGTVLGYRYATSTPNTRPAKGFDSAPMDLSESEPRISLVGGEARLQRAAHHEFALSQRIGENSLQVAYFSDVVQNTALTGVGEVGLGGDFLADPYSGTFNYLGGDLRTSGLRLVMQRKVGGGVTATGSYAYGGVIYLNQTGVEVGQLPGALRSGRRHAVAGKLAGSVPGARTRWIASYRWTAGDALTPVDPFDASPGQADPFLSIFLRQPLPSTNFLPGRMEALIDVRNLLAQGYVPVLGNDGSTLYLVQSARSVRGGLSFTF